MIREMVTLLIERRDFFLGLLGEHLGISLTAILIAVLLGGLVGVLISEFDRSAKPTLAVINFSYVPSLLNGRDRARTRAALPGRALRRTAAESGDRPGAGRVPGDPAHG